MRRNFTFVLLGLLLALTVACTNKKSVNPLANVGSKQPDKVLFDRVHGCDEAQPLRRGAHDAANADQYLSGFGIYRARQAGGGGLVVCRGRHDGDAAGRD